MRIKKFLSIIASLAILAQSAIQAPLASATGETSSTKIGLIYSNDGTNSTNKWLAPTGGSIESYVNYKTDATDNTTTYAELTSNSTAKNNKLENCSYMYAPLGENKIKFEQGKVIVVDMKFRAYDVDTTSYDKRVQVKYNLSTDHSAFQVKYQGTSTTTTTPIAYDPGGNHLALMELTNYGMRFSNGATAPSGSNLNQNSWIGQYKGQLGSQNNKWYRVVMKIAYGMNIDYEVYEEGNATAIHTTHGQPHWITQSEYLENIAIMNLHNQQGNVDVDYLKVYNVPEAMIDIYSEFDGAYDEVEISNVMVDGKPIAQVSEATKGTVTFETTANVSNVEVYYMKKGVKTTLTKGTDYTFQNNTVTFTDDLVGSAEYTVLLDLGYIKYPIEFITPWKQQVGLIYENDGTSGWMPGADFTQSSAKTKVNISYETAADNTTYVHLAPSGSITSQTATDSTPYAYAPLGYDKIKFEDDKVVIVEFKLRTNAVIDDNVSRTRIDYNMPEQPNPLTTATFNYINKNTSEQRVYEAHVRRDLLQEYYHNGTASTVRFGTGDWPGGGTTINKDTWYTSVITMYPDHKVEHKVIKPDGTTLTTFNGTPLYISASNFFENIAAGFWLRTNDYANANVYTDIDYLRVYTVPTALKDSYKNFTGAYDELLEVSDIKVDGVLVPSKGVVDATDGTVTFSANSDGVTVKEVYYEKNGEKVSVAKTAYTLQNNTVTFVNNLENNAKYTVVLDLGHSEYPVSFYSDWEQPTGLIYENNGTSGWNVGYDFINNETQKADIDYKTESGRTYMHFEPSGSANKTSYLSAPMVYMPLGEDSIKFKKGYTIVTEMMVRTVADVDATHGRPRINYSFPEDSSLANFTYINDQTLGETGQKQTKYTANLCSEVLMDFLTGSMRFGVATYPVGSTPFESNKWYKLTMAIDGNYQARYTVTDPEDDSIVATYGGQMQIKPESGFFENIALTTWMAEGNLTKGDAYTDVDYIKVYNMPSKYADEYYMCSGNVSEAEIIGLDTNGVIALTFDEALTAANLEDIEITNRNNRVIKFAATISQDAKTVTIRVADPLDADRYIVKVLGENFKYNVSDPYEAELSMDGFTTDIPEIFAKEGATFYKAQYDSEGKLTAVEAIPVTADITSATLGDANAKVFLWDKNNKPIATYKDTYTVAFLGGSLTEGGQIWRDKVKAILEENMPDKEIIAYTAGKGGTASNYGAARFGADIAPFEPDLLFIDFAVNDEGSFGDNETNNKVYMESIVQQCLELENVPDIVFLYTPRPYNKDTEAYEIWEKGMMWKEEIANHYGIKSIDIYDYMHNDWEANYKSEYPVFTDYLVEELGYRRTATGIDVHAGYAKYAEAIEKAYRDDYASCFTTPKNPEIYSLIIDKVKADYAYIPVTSDRISYDSGWTLTTKANPGLTTPYYLSYPYFVNGMLQSTTPNAELTITTDANEIALCFYSSTTGGKYKYYIDGAETGTEVNCLATTNGSPVQCRWINLPGDGKTHTVRIVTDSGTSNTNVVRTGDIIEYHKGH